MIKNLFIPVEYKIKLNKDSKKKLSSLPNNLIIIYTSQYKQIALKIKNIIKNKKILEFQQVLGCSILKSNKKTQAILFIGAGEFHPVSIAQNTLFPVYTYYPEDNSLKKINKEQINKLNQKQKSAYMNFLKSNKIGILISTKPGQNRLKKAINLKNKLKNKQSYLFIGNNLNSSEFENFDIQSWVNTACPRLDLESNKIINYNNTLL